MTDQQCEDLLTDIHRIEKHLFKIANALLILAEVQDDLESIGEREAER